MCEFWKMTVLLDLLISNMTSSENIIRYYNIIYIYIYINIYVCRVTICYYYLLLGIKFPTAYSPFSEFRRQVPKEHPSYAGAQVQALSSSRDLSQNPSSSTQEKMSGEETNQLPVIRFLPKPRLSCFCGSLQPMDRMYIVHLEGQCDFSFKVQWSGFQKGNRIWKDTPRLRIELVKNKAMKYKTQHELKLEISPLKGDVSPCGRTKTHVTYHYVLHTWFF